MNIYLDLVLTFMRIGLFTFGGGYSMLPLLQREIVEKRGWATEDQLLDYYAVGQSIPGLIGVNTASFIGYKKKGIPGAIVSSLALVTPSVIVILIIAAIFDLLLGFDLISNAFSGIRIAVCALVSYTVYKLAKAKIVDVLTFIWMLAAFAAIAFFNLSPIWVVVLSFIAGNAAKAIGGKKR